MKIQESHFLKPLKKTFHASPHYRKDCGFEYNLGRNVAVEVESRYINISKPSSSINP